MPAHWGTTASGTSVVQRLRSVFSPPWKRLARRLRSAPTRSPLRVRTASWASPAGLRAATLFGFPGFCPSQPAAAYRSPECQLPWPKVFSRTDVKSPLPHQLFQQFLYPGSPPGAWLPPSRISRAQLHLLAGPLKHCAGPTTSLVPSPGRHHLA